MLLTPLSRGNLLQSSQSVSSSEGTTITASGSIHTKGGWSPVIASTSRIAYGITILIHAVGVASTNSRMLVDIGIGGSGTELVLIPDLLAGNAPSWSAATNGGCMYHFPLIIPASSRLSARCQALIASDVCNVLFYLHQAPRAPGMFYGSRVTAYGITAASSTGTSHTPGSTSAYSGTNTSLTGSTTNPIKYMQLGMDLGTSTTGTSMRGMARIGIGSSPVWLASDLPIGESTTVESMDLRMANFILSHMNFNVPSGKDLRINAMVSGTGVARGFAVYGVD